MRVSIGLGLGQGLWDGFVWRLAVLVERGLSQRQLKAGLACRTRHTCHTYHTCRARRARSVSHACRASHARRACRLLAQQEVRLDEYSSRRVNIKV